MVGDLSTLEIWSESQKINEVAKKDCLHLFILNIKYLIIYLDINYCALIGRSSFQSDEFDILKMVNVFITKKPNEFKQKNKSLLSELALELVNDTRGLIKIVQQDSTTKHLTVPRV